jgi:hypothetical protein
MNIKTWKSFKCYPQSQIGKHEEKKSKSKQKTMKQMKQFSIFKTEICGVMN